MLTPYKISRK